VNPAGVRLELGTDLDLRDEVSDRDELDAEGARVEAHGGKRPIDEVLQARQAAFEDPARASVDGHLTALDDLKGQRCRAQHVAQLVGEIAKALRALVLDRELTLVGVLPDGPGNGIVEAEVERLEFPGGDRGVHLHGELGDRLAHVAVVVNDLADGESHAKQVAAVTARARVDLYAVLTTRLRMAQRYVELVQKNGNTSEAPLPSVWVGPSPRPSPWRWK